MLFSNSHSSSLVSTETLPLPQVSPSHTSSNFNKSCEDQISLPQASIPDVEDTLSPLTIP